MHCMPCCSKCEICGKRIKIGAMDWHVKDKHKEKKIMTDHTCIYCGIECDCESAQDECFGCSRCIQERNAIAAQEDESAAEIVCDESGWVDEG